MASHRPPPGRALEEPLIRPATPADLPAIEAIQQSSPEAAHWPPADYLEHDCRVVEEAGEVVAFQVVRKIYEGEFELLNIAVAPSHRGRGHARALLAEMPVGRLFLEVRESNQAARALYESVGFRVTGKRKGYYAGPPEDGIVMESEK